MKKGPAPLRFPLDAIGRGTNNEFMTARPATTPTGCRLITKNFTTMNAIILPAYGTAETLQYQEVDKPTPKSDEVLVHIRAAGVNHIDYEKASGVMQHVFPLTFPWIPGYDFAGIIETVGNNVKNVAVGDEVYGTSTHSGTYAEYVVIHPDQFARKPRTLSFVEAASVPVSAETAWQVLFDHAHLGQGQTVLIHGGAGAVGTYAVQLAHQAGATVIVTASSHTKDIVSRLGADLVIDYQLEGFENLVSEVDVVIDLVGGSMQERSYGVLKKGGYLVAINQPVSPTLASQYGIHAVFVELHPSRDGLSRIAQLIDTGQLRIHMGNVYPLSKATEAWQELTGQPVTNRPKRSGRIVLQVD
ncbi:NADP-dependent oxidoreductase [soil metagenome]